MNYDELFTTDPEIKIKKTYYPKGDLHSVMYTKNGKRHREDGPAVLRYWNSSGLVMVKEYYVEGKRHREGGPAEIWYKEDGTLKYESFYVDGYPRDCEKGALYIDYHKNGNVRVETYKRDGDLHREDGPALKYYQKDGTPYREMFMKSGTRHREDGPAILHFGDRGEVTYCFYYIEDVQFPFWEFFERSTPETQKILLKDWLPYYHA
jgi:antitoxin component YwqK of YwqJK toxin-antitoxin module